MIGCGRARPNGRRLGRTPQRIRGRGAGVVGAIGLLALVLPPLAAAGATPRATAASPTAGPAGSTVSVYFLRDELVAAARREVEPPTREAATAAVTALLAGPTEAEREACLATDIPENTELLGIAIDASSKVATVDLSEGFTTAGSNPAASPQAAGCSLTASPRVEGSNRPPAERLAQVVYTLTQFPSIAAVRLLIDGQPTDAFAGAGVDANEAVDRAAVEAQTPPIFVESPAVGDAVGSPLRVRGTANTYEAAFVLTVVDADGGVLAEEVVRATSGSGTRGTFDVTVAFAVERPGPGKLVVFERAPSAGGERVNVVEIPIELTA